MKIFELDINGVINKVQTTLNNIEIIARNNWILDKHFRNNDLFIYTKYDLFIFKGVKCKTLEIFIEV